jgi:hypothetical protein
VLVELVGYDQAGPVREGRVKVLHYEGKFGSGEASWGYVDESGAIVIPLQFGYAWNFSGGLARVEDRNGKLAYIDLDGNYVWREEAERRADLR